MTTSYEIIPFDELVKTDTPSEQELRIQKAILLEEVKIKVAHRDKLFGQLTLEDPLSQEEKDLTKEIAVIYSNINSLVKLLKTFKQ